jgi:hypothetical protein
VEVYFVDVDADVVGAVLFELCLRSVPITVQIYKLRKQLQIAVVVVNNSIERS